MLRVCAVALPMVCFVLASCSRLKRPELFDVMGCGEIKWGMTLSQAKTLLGSRAQVTTDPQSGKTLETVKMMVGDTELSGFVSTKAESDRISGVHLIYKAELPVEEVKQEKFKGLKDILIKQYGPPSKELSETSERLCFWGFPSGNVVLTTTVGGLVGLSYTQNEFDPRTGKHH
jgi:hypothetical protein